MKNKTTLTVELKELRKSICEKIRKPGYHGALTEIASRSNYSYGYVRQVLIIQDRWNEDVIKIADEVLNEFDSMNQTSCPVNCGPSDYHPGGKCDDNGCYDRGAKMKRDPDPRFPSSCDLPCGPSDYYPGGMCDENGCYDREEESPARFALQISLMRKKIAGHEARLNVICDLLDKHESRLESHFKQLDTHARSLAGIEKDIDEIKTHLAWIGDDREREFYKVVDELERMERLVLNPPGAATPALLDAQQAILDSLLRDMAAAENDIQVLKKSLVWEVSNNKQLRKRIEALEKSAPTFWNRIQSLFK